jgi:hypothetical protein
VALAYNPSYSICRDWEDCDLRPAWAKVIETPSQPIAGCGGACLSSQPLGRCKWEDCSPGQPRLKIGVDPIPKTPKAKRTGDLS